MPREKKSGRTVASARRESPAFTIALMVMSLIVIAITVLLGRSDKGAINVSAAIESSNQARQNAGESSEGNVPVVREVFRTKVNGGLVPSDAVEVAPVPVAEVGEESAENTPTEEGSSLDTPDAPEAQ